MRLIFGFMALLIVLAVIAKLSSTQLGVFGLTGSATTRAANQGADTKAVTDAVMGRARNGGATIAVPGDMGGMAGAAPAVADVTVPMQAQSIQNNVRDQTNAALQKGVNRNNAAQP
jgi:hypothetical protein